MKFILVWSSYVVLTVLGQTVQIVTNNLTKSVIELKQFENEIGIDDGEFKDDPFAAIYITEPIYLETIKSASLSITKPATFKWTLQGKAKRPPESLTMTLVVNKGSVVSHVIAKDLDPKRRSFIWDIPNYKPANNESESITLRLGQVYHMYLHDSRVEFNAQKLKGSYHTGHTQFNFYHPSNPNDPFAKSFMQLPSTVFAAAVLIASLILL